MTSVLVLALLVAQQAMPPQKCSLSGTVVDSVTGLPLGKVEVVAEHPSGWDPSSSTVTDAAGRFRMVNVDPGPYRISVKRNGYLDSWYGARRSSSGGTTIVLTAGQKLDDIQIRMAPIGVIAGTVRDADGEPLGGIYVNVLASQFDGGQRVIRDVDNVVTDDLGQYRSSKLPAGKYYVTAGPETHANENWKAPVVDRSVRTDKPREATVSTYYPGTTDPFAAGLVQVASGARVTGIDIALARSPVYKVSIHVDLPKGLKATASLRSSAEGFGGLGDFRWVNPNGDMAIEGVPPGNYRIVIGTLAQETADTVGSLSVQCETSAPLTVGKADVSGVRVAAVGCAQVSGHVAYEGDEPKLAESNYAVHFGTTDFANRASVDSDGSFSANLSPGHHVVDLAGLTGMYVKSIRSGNQDVLRNGFTLGGPERIELDVVLASDGGQIEGVVTDSDDKPVLGAAVVLIPNDPALRPRLDFTRDVVTDGAGHFELKGAAPGEYRLFAWDDIEKGSWFDPDVLKDFEGQGTPLTVKAGSGDTARQTINLRVIK